MFWWHRTHFYKCDFNDESSEIKMKNFIMRTFFNMWPVDSVELSITAFREAPPSENEELVRRASNLGRHVLDLLGPDSLVGVEAPAGESVLAVVYGSHCTHSAELQGPGVSGQMDSKYRVTALSFCFIFSSKTLSCFIRWGTGGADQVSVGERKKRRTDEEIQEKILICPEIHVHSQARVSSISQASQ